MILADLTPRSRPALLRIAAITGLVLITAAVIINHVALTKQAEQIGARTNQIAMLYAQVAALGEDISQLPQPQTFPLDRYESEHQALEQRLKAVEQALNAHLAEDSLAPLQARIDQLTARIEARPPVQPPAPTRPATPAASRAPAKAAPLTPPFEALGIELRGDHQFLSIRSTGTSSLSEVRLLRPGETEAGWRFDALDGNSAVLRQGGTTNRLTIPAKQVAP